MDTIPCPDRIIDDCGGAFIMGAVGSGILNFFKGYRNTPGTSLRKFGGSLQAIRQQSALTGGAFASWGFTFSIFDCMIARYRKKEDPLNSIFSGACTGGLLSLKQGRRAILTGAVVGGLFLALIEGAGIVITNHQSENEEKQQSLEMTPYKGAAVDLLTNNAKRVGSIDSQPVEDRSLEDDDDFFYSLGEENLLSQENDFSD